VTLTAVTFQSNSAAGGSGGAATCVPGDFTCFGVAGDGGLAGGKGLGGTNLPLNMNNGSAPDGKVGNDGIGGRRRPARRLQRRRGLRLRRGQRRLQLTNRARRGRSRRS